MKTLSKYMLLGVAGMGLWSCSSEEAVKELTGSGRTVQITVNVSREGDAATRTQMSDEGANLGCVWTEGDKLLVTDASGAKKGVLNLTEINAENPSMATFNGQLDDVTIVDGKSALNFMYLGTKWDATAAIAENKYVADYSQQDGSLKSLTDKDMLAKSETVTAFEDKDGKCRVYVESLNLKRQISFARFKLDQLPDGVTLGPGTSVTVSDINSTANLATTDLTPTYGAGSVTITPTEEGNEFYMVLLPTTDTPTIKFTVSANGYSYTATKAATAPIAAEKYYRHQNGSNYEAITISNWEKKEEEKIAFDTSAWGADGKIIQPGYERNDIVFTYDWGWMNNENSVPTYGGWATWITYTHNGKLASGLMVSDEIKEIGAGKYFFQWGRYLGFTNIVGKLIYDPYGDVEGSYNDSSYPLGIDKNEQAVGMCSHNSVKGLNGRCYISDMSKKKSVDCSLVFASISSFSDDYLTDNATLWEERCGNPAPKGYRIPTTDDYKAVIPSGCSTNGKYVTISGSMVEVKEFNGIKYAMKWTVISGSMPALEVRSFVTTSDNIKSDDTRFENSVPLTFKALGYLTTGKAEHKESGKQGWFWACDTYVYTDGTKYGSQLEIVFNGSTAKVSIQPCERAAGMPVMLIKDNTKTPDSINPLFPLTGAATKHVVGYPSNWYGTDKD